MNKPLKIFLNIEKIHFFFLSFLPLIIFLNKYNLPQLEFEEIKIILTSQILLFFFVVVLGTITFNFFFKKKYLNINLPNFLSILFFLYYLSFYYDEAFTKNLHNVLVSGYYFSAFVFLVLIILIFLVLLNLYNKSIKIKNYILIFTTIFLVINYLIFVINFSSHILNKNILLKSKNLNLVSNVNVKNNIDKNIDIYFIVLDGMMSLNSAHNNKIIDKENELEKFKKLGGKISQNAITNYNTSDLSLTSIFEMDYFITEGANQYYDIRGLFPKLMNTEQIPLVEMLKKINREIYWVGNEWAYCKPKKINTNIKCLFFNNTKIYITLNKFYKNNPFIHFISFAKDYLLLNDYYYLNSFDYFFDTKNAIQNINVNFSDKNKFFFIHVYKPHPPYIFDSNCNILKNEINNKIVGYKNNYKCTLNRIPYFIEDINKQSDKKKIFFFVGDHGWFEDQKNIMLLGFNKICSGDLPNSTINLIRYSLNCSDNLDLPYLEDKYFEANFIYKQNGIYGDIIKK